MDQPTTLTVVTMPRAEDPYPPGHECGYICGCPQNQAAVAKRVKMGLRATPKQIKQRARAQRGGLRAAA